MLTLAMNETLTIARLGQRGDGVAETAQGQVFVPFALPGESVRAVRDGDRAQVVEILTPSASRIAAICPLFTRCGGCAAQHMGEGLYAEWKRQQVVTAHNSQGQLVNRVELAPPVVRVVVPVEQWPGRKEVAVRVSLVGQPAAGYRLSTVRVNPSTVVLLGNTDVLADVPGFVETSPISSISSAKSLTRWLRKASRSASSALPASLLGSRVPRIILRSIRSDIALMLARGLFRSWLTIEKK